jgi:single-stranded-DNA-specific exonuclease
VTAPMQKQIVRRRIVESGAAFGTDLHPLLARIYCARDVTRSSEISRELSALLPPRLKGIDIAVQRLQTAVQNGERIVVIGDFDADGATSCALAVLALRAMGHHDVNFLVPNRFEYGYGLTPEIVALAAVQKPQVIVTVDNGIASFDGVDRANTLGIDVIVTDHHLAAERLPAACAIVNPNQPGCEFPSKALAGVGVIFYVMSALRSALRAAGWFAQRGIAEPNMSEFLDLVALGTVADVVPLDCNNRILVHQGLRRIRAGRARPGILALLEVAGRRHERVVASDMGFAVAPRLNAAGRLDDMTHGILCLLTEDPALAREFALELDALNRDRRQIETGMQLEAERLIKGMSIDESGLPYCFCLYDEGWHQGVIGILAARIKERYHRPVIAFAPGEKAGELKGSARSINGVHIRDVLDIVATRHPGLLTKFGGHAMAAGLSLPQQNFAAFSQAINDAIAETVDENHLHAVLLSDGELTQSDFNLFVAQLLREAGPWGQHFPEPLFDGVFRVIQQRVVGEKHLKLVLTPHDNARLALDAIWFNADLALWPLPDNAHVQVAYRLDVNEFRGQQNLQLMVEWLAPAVVAAGSMVQPVYG